MMDQTQKVEKKKILMMPILTLLAIGYFGFLLYQAIYVNYHTNKKIDQYTKSLEQSKSEQNALTDLIAYYKTSTFQELEARKKLGLKMPGEKVVKVEVPQAKQTAQPSKKVEAALPHKSNGELWIDYLFNQ